MRNECNSHNFILLAIFVPKLSHIVKIRQSSDHKKNNFAHF